MSLRDDMAEDMAALFNAEELGETVQFQARGLAATPITVLWRDGSLSKNEDIGGGAQHLEDDAAMWVQHTELTALGLQQFPHESEIIRFGRSWVVVGTPKRIDANTWEAMLSVRGRTIRAGGLS